MLVAAAFGLLLELKLLAIASRMIDVGSSGFRAAA